MSRLWYSMRFMSIDWGQRAAEGPEIICFFPFLLEINSPNSAANSTVLISCCLDENGFLASIFEIRLAFSRYLESLFFIKTKWILTSCFRVLLLSLQRISHRLRGRIYRRPELCTQEAVNMSNNTFPNPLYSIIPAFLGWSPKIGMKIPKTDNYSGSYTISTRHPSQRCFLRRTHSSMSNECR